MVLNYSIIKKRSIISDEEMPSCFLADTAEEAEKIYKSFEKMLNNISYSYSVGTGIDKDDLFMEAIIGLARAYRDWGGDRGYSFKTYAVYRIKEALNEYVSHNSVIVKIPSYIKKVQANITKLMDLCYRNSLDWKDVIYSDISTIAIDHDMAIKIRNYRDNIRSAADRSGIEYEVFIKRVQMVPTVVECIDEHACECDELDLKMLVSDIINVVSDDEKKICELIMSDHNNCEIATIMSKSESWVRKKLLKIRDTITRKD